MQNPDTKELLQSLKGSLKTRGALHMLRGKLKWQDFVDTFDQRLELIDLQPSKRKAGSLPLLIVPGFSGNAEVVRTHAKAMQDRGRRVLCVNAPHGVHIQHKKSLPQTRKAVALLGALQEKELTEVDAMGYSEASITIAIAAKLRPSQFRNIVLMNPAGMIGEDSLIRLILSFTVDKIHEGIREMIRGFREHVNMREKWKILREKTKYILSDPFQSAKEVRAMTAAQIHLWLRELQEKHGIKIALVQSAGDKVFPREKMESFIQAAGIPPDHVFHDLQGTHDVMLANPEHAVDVAEQALCALEAEC